MVILEFRGGGAKKTDWKRDNHSVKFHFTSQEKRELFEKKASCLLLKNLWDKTSENNKDSATPQS